MKAEQIYHKLKEIVKPIHAHADQMEAIAHWIEKEFEPKEAIWKQMFGVKKILGKRVDVFQNELFGEEGTIKVYIHPNDVSEEKRSEVNEFPSPRYKYEHVHIPVLESENDMLESFKSMHKGMVLLSGIPKEIIVMGYEDGDKSVIHTHFNKTIDKIPDLATKTYKEADLDKVPSPIYTPKRKKFKSRKK